uniref:Putative salivary platelet aggregation inhibitor 2 n=1 Tax=Rhodnius prolixus TaxID=13249 RepID=R4G4G7_RHOPR
MIIIVATLLGLLGHTFAAADASATTTMPKECHELKDDIKPGFDANQFFKGDWYLTHARDKEDPPRCEKYQTKTNLQLTFNGKNGDVTCQGTKMDGKDGFYSFQCTTEKGQSFTSFMMVLETDYNNYALLYRCGRYGSTVLDNFFVINRQSSGGIPEGLNAKLGELDLKTSLNKLGCTS